MVLGSFSNEPISKREAVFSPRFLGIQKDQTLKLCTERVLAASVNPRFLPSFSCFSFRATCFPGLTHSMFRF